jgi:hypothetical protein
MRDQIHLELKHKQHHLHIHLSIMAMYAFTLFLNIYTIEAHPVWYGIREREDLPKTTKSKRNDRITIRMLIR